ncbi:23S rRNA (adenine(1618)-N(6))-methyltransferase RlmF [Vibrio sp. SCSIO 43136]|nr:23S rRNA (adenine(1618)-N(6))-methyltransferase RlmF [Vibrio sp. SCSIO 43136]
MKGLHPNNPHSGRYDFSKLIKALPELTSHTVKTPTGDTSINFGNDESVKLLNKALLIEHYQVLDWDIPKGFLCPPIPGRADYVHHIAELLSLTNGGKLPKGVKVSGLDIGTGANLIYPIVACQSYGWQMKGSDIDIDSLNNGQRILASNQGLANKLTLVLQGDANKVFANVLEAGESVDFTMCNPPFHSSLAEAMKGSERKRNNLAQNREKRGSQTAQKNQSQLNFGGQKAELWCEGGEERFVRNMAFESQKYSKQCLWFTTLLSKKENVRQLTRALDKVSAKQVKVVEMKHGQKITRFVAWTFLEPKEQKLWAETKWR